MFKKKDRIYLNEPNIYSMALEKYFFDKYYNNEDEKKGNSTPGQAFQFSNELHHETFKRLTKKEKKRAAVVGSSGDQALNAIYYGAKDVTLIDANLYSKYFTEYKIAAIKNLDYLTFAAYFFHNNKMFNPEVFRLLFQDLSPDAQTFWGTLFIEDSSHKIFRKMINDWCFPDGSAFYKSEPEYNELKQKLDSVNIHYINGDFEEFPELLDGEYDLIMLSNIFDYVPDEKFVSVVNKLYDNHLTKGGQIQLHYMLHHPVKTGAALPYLFEDKKVTKHTFKMVEYYDAKNATYILTKPQRQTTKKTTKEEPTM